MLKNKAKEGLFMLAKMCMAPLVVMYALFNQFSTSDEVFCSFGQFISLFPGKFGSYCRVAFYAMTTPSFSSKNVAIGFGSYFAHPEIELREGVYIGAYCIIGKVILHEHNTIGSNVQILSGTKQHFYKQKGVPIQNQGGEFSTIEIGQNCWLGNGAIVMADLGEQCVVGAGAVVTKAAGDFLVLAGNPAVRKDNVS